MRMPLYDVNARRKTVSITLKADHVAKASALGINMGMPFDDWANEVMSPDDNDHAG